MPNSSPVFWARLAKTHRRDQSLKWRSRNNICILVPSRHTRKADTADPESGKPWSLGPQERWMLLKIHKPLNFWCIIIPSSHISNLFSIYQRDKNLFQYISFIYTHTKIRYPHKKKSKPLSIQSSGLKTDNNYYKTWNKFAAGICLLIKYIQLLRRPHPGFNSTQGSSLRQEQVQHATEPAHKISLTQIAQTGTWPGCNI